MKFIRKSYLANTLINDPIGLMIQNRLSKKNNQNFVCFWAGATGSGKTFSAVSYFSKVDPNFGPENVIWTMKELMDILTKKEFRNGKPLIPGSIIIFDEFPSQVGSRDWYTVLNKVCIKILQTFRDLNIGLCLTGPSLSLTDSKTKILLHAYFENDPEPIRKYALVKTKVYQLIHNSRNNKTYTHHYNFVINGQKLKIPHILVGLPPQALIDEVEKLSKERKEEIREEGEHSIEAFLNEVKLKKSRSDKFSPSDIGDKVMQSLDKYYLVASNGLKTIDSKKIAVDFDISFYSAQIVSRYVKGKVDLETGKPLQS